ncbi:MAG TPA: polysaccharide deacetylase family protein [Gemmatimonadaceae bacterium]|nr:polysaccharide deacetylase family protein [Gemmatimonadaceae bacterium]
MRAIITYHSIDPSRSAISTSEQEFRRHVDWLAGNKSVSVVSLEKLLASKPEDHVVALTFDDAFQNFRSVAAPILRAHGLPALLFVATAHAGGTNAWPSPRGTPEVPVLPLMDWSDIASVAEDGVSIGSHARTHRLLSSLSAADLREEIAESAADVQRETGIAPAALAYPYGIASAREQKEAARVYDLAVGAELSVIGDESNRFMLPRIDAYYLRKPGVLESFGSPRFDRFLKLRNRGRQLRTSVNRLLGQGGA